MPSVFYKRLIFGVFLTFLSMPGWAQWQLDSAESQLYYVTSKAAAISEINTFSRLSGSIDESGNAVLEIDLSSVDTAIEIRNQRMQEILFETTDYPQAEVSVSVDSSSLENLAVGETEIASYSFSLSLHGMSQTFSSDLKVTKLSNERIEIQSVQPVLINAGQFALAQGVEALREVAGLPSINPNVVVTFTLVYQQSM